MEGYECDYELDAEELQPTKPLSAEQKAERDEWLMEAANLLKEINGK